MSQRMRPSRIASFARSPGRRSPLATLRPHEPEVLKGPQGQRESGGLLRTHRSSGSEGGTSCSAAETNDSRPERDETVGERAAGDGLSSFFVCRRHRDSRNHVVVAAERRRFAAEADE